MSVAEDEYDAFEAFDTAGSGSVRDPYTPFVSGASTDVGGKSLEGVWPRWPPD
jgi:hypothetical protein